MNTLTRLLLLALLPAAFHACKMDDQEPASLCKVIFNSSEEPSDPVKIRLERFDLQGYLVRTDYFYQHDGYDITSSVLTNYETYEYDSNHHLTEYLRDKDLKINFINENGLPVKVEYSYFGDIASQLSSYDILEYENSSITKRTRYKVEGSAAPVKDTSIIFYYHEGVIDSIYQFRYIIVYNTVEVGSNSIVTFTYDGQKNLTSRSTISDSYPLKKVDERYDYNELGQLVGYSYSNLDVPGLNSQAQYTYNELGNVAQEGSYVSDWLVGSYTYTYSNCGSKKMIRPNIWPYLFNPIRLIIATR